MHQDLPCLMHRNSVLAELSKLTADHGKTSHIQKRVKGAYVDGETAMLHHSHQPQQGHRRTVPNLAVEKLTGLKMPELAKTPDIHQQFFAAGASISQRVADESLSLHQQQLATVGNPVQGGVGTALRLGAEKADCLFK